MKKAILINLLLFTALWAQEQKLTLQQSIELGLKNSRELKISQSRLTGADARVTETTSQMLPQLRFAAGYTRLSDVPPFEVTLPIPGAPQRPIRISEVYLNNYTMRLSLQQPLFTGFRLANLRSAAKKGRMAAEADYTKEINESAFKIQSAYWQYYKARQMLNLINENLSANERHVQDTRNFLENGLVTRNDLLRLEVQNSNMKLQQIEAQNNLDIARMAFNQALGLPLESPSAIVTEEIKPSGVTSGIDALIKEAKENRSDLKAMQLRADAGSNSVSAARSGWLPQLYLTGNFYYSNPSQRIQPPKDEFRDTWDVGLQLSWDLWNWGYTSSQTVQAEQVKIQAETSLSQLTDAVEIEVYQNYLTLSRSREKVDVSRSSVEQAAENLRTINEKYNAQLATSTDLVDAETLLLQAQTNLNNALVDYRLAEARLHKSLGRRIW